MEKKSINLKLVIKIITSHIDFVLEDISKGFSSKVKYLLKEMCMIFQLITILLINLTF